MRATATADDEYSCKYHDGSKYLLPSEDVHADEDAYDCGNDWLDIAVHADQGRADALLTVWYKEICHECGENYQISEFPHLYVRYHCPFKRKHFAE